MTTRMLQFVRLVTIFAAGGVLTSPARAGERVSIPTPPPAQISIDNLPPVEAPVPAQRTAHGDGRHQGHSTGSSSGCVEQAPGCACAEATPARPDCCEKQKKLAEAVAGAHKGLFYDNDFSYLCDPDYCDWWPGDRLKRNGLGPCICVDVGGQYRLRQHAERNIRGLGLTGLDDDFLLHRTRIYTNVEFGDDFRFYAEYLDAVSNYEQLTPRPIEENRSDLLNLFVDGTLLDSHLGSLKGRVGRQELLYGQQRAVSPLDWANTRRTFDGGKLMWEGEDWKIDSFWTRPILPLTHRFDRDVHTQQFYGIYSSRKRLKSDALEWYWLAFDDEVTGFRADSLGGRYYKTKGDWLFEAWGNYQFGQNSDDSSHTAGAWTLGIGRKFNHCWNPTVWLYYDWASGGDVLGAGNGYFHFFPLAHKYLGFMDLYGRRNIQTPNVQFNFQPAEKIKVLLWYYYFMLQTTNDTPYSVVMTPFAPGVRPGSADLGHEIDCLVTYAINPRMELQLGYSYFLSGEYYNTPGVPFSGDASFYYTQYTFNF